MEQRRFKFKEDIRFFADDTKQVEIMRLKARQRFDPFTRGDRVVATNTRRAWTIRDTHTIDLSGDPERTLDRRLVLATAVGMDALQAR